MAPAGKKPIVVGVTGAGLERAALAFAAEIAKRDGSDIVLVHAVQDIAPPPPPAYLLTYEQAHAVAEHILAEVRQELDRMTGEAVRVRTLARAGRPAGVLVEASRDARLVVVQHKTERSLGRLFIGSTANGAAARADCPVVSVPGDWEPSRLGAEVVVGVHGDGSPRQAIAAGLAWADAAGTSVRVVHGWRLDPAYEGLITEVMAEEWNRQAEKAISDVVAEARKAHSSVTVSVEAHHEWPTPLLIELSATAGMVVVGRHGIGRLLGERLGSHARTLLKGAKGPVMVVPVRPEADSPDDDADDVSPQT